MTNQKELLNLPGVKQLVHGMKSVEAKVALVSILGLFAIGDMQAQTSGKIKVDPVPAFTITKTPESIQPGMGMAVSLTELRQTFKNDIYVGLDGGILPVMTIEGKGSLNAFTGLRVGKKGKEIRLGYATNATGADTLFIGGKVSFGGKKKG